MAVPDDAPPREDWNRRVLKERILSAFDKWHFPWLDMPALIRRTPEFYEFPLVDRYPVQAWTFGRVTLIGDAAHPMQPIGSQAGSQAIIDAQRSQAHCLNAECGRGAKTLRMRAQAHDERHNAAQPTTWTGSSHASGRERAPAGFDRIDDVITREEIKVFVASFSSAAGLDVETVNGRPSFVPVQRS